MVDYPRIENCILLERFKAIYVFIPKVACTSIKTVFAELIGLEYEGSIHDAPFTKIPKSALKNEYKDYFKFGFVRNPWDRLASCYVSRDIKIGDS